MIRCMQCQLPVATFSTTMFSTNQPKDFARVFIARCGCGIITKVDDEIFVKKREVQISIEESQLERNFGYELASMKRHTQQDRQLRVQCRVERKATLYPTAWERRIYKEDSKFPLCPDCGTRVWEAREHHCTATLTENR